MPLHVLDDLEELDARGNPVCAQPEAEVPSDGDETWARLLFAFQRCAHAAGVAGTKPCLLHHHPSLTRLHPRSCRVMVLNGRQVAAVDRVKVEERFGFHNPLYQSLFEGIFPGEERDALCAHCTPAAPTGPLPRSPAARRLAQHVLHPASPRHRRGAQPAAR